MSFQLEILGKFEGKNTDISCSIKKQNLIFVQCKKKKIWLREKTNHPLLEVKLLIPIDIHQYSNKYSFDGNEHEHGCDTICILTN